MSSVNTGTQPGIYDWRARLALTARVHLERRLGESLADCQLRLSGGCVPQVRVAVDVKRKDFDEERYDVSVENKNRRVRAKRKRAAQASRATVRTA